MTIKHKDKTEQATSSNSSSSHSVEVKKSSEQVMHHAREETVSKGKYVQESQHSYEKEKRERVLMDSQGNVISQQHQEFVTSESQPTTSSSKVNSNLEQLDFLAAELIDSANAIGDTSRKEIHTSTTTTSGLPPQDPNLTQKNVVYERREEQVPGGPSKLAVCKEELKSSANTVDYAASYLIAHTETWDSNSAHDNVTTGNNTAALRTNDKTSKFSTTTTTGVDQTITDNIRNDSSTLEVTRDFITEVDHRNTAAADQMAYVVEYESKHLISDTIYEDSPVHHDDSGYMSTSMTKTTSYKPGNSSWDGTFVYEKPAPSPHSRRRTADRKIEKRSGTVDIREVTEDNSINEIDYCTSSNYTVQHASSGHDLTSTFQQQQQQPTEVRIVRSRSRSLDRSNGTTTMTEMITETTESVQVDHNDAGQIEETIIRHEVVETRSRSPSRSRWDGTYVTDDTNQIIHQVKKEETLARQAIDEIANNTVRSRSPSKTRYTTSSTSAWDGTFVTEKSRETSVERDSSQLMKSSSKLMTTARDGSFIYSSPEPPIRERESLVVTTLTIDVTDHNEPQNIETSRLDMSASDFVKDTKKRKEIEVVVIDKPTARPRSKSPEKTVITSSSKLNASTWDGSFVMETPQQPRHRSRTPEKSKTTVTAEVKDVVVTMSYDNVPTPLETEIFNQTSSFTSVRDFTNLDQTEINQVHTIIRNVDETEMVTQDVALNESQFEQISTSTTHLPIVESPTRFSPERTEPVRPIPFLRDDSKVKITTSSTKKSKSSHDESITKISQKRLSDGKITPKLPEITKPAEWIPDAASTPKEKGPKKELTPLKTPDVLAKIPLKEQCICELCTCGRHRCPHNDFQEHIEISKEPIITVSSYKEEYDEKHVDRQSKYYREDHLRMEGEFIGERRNDYIVTQGERAPVIIPQDNLKPEGEIETVTTTELVFTGISGERPRAERRNTYTKVEGEFTDQTTTRTEFVDHRNFQRSEIIRQSDNLKTEGDFEGTSHTKEDYTYEIIPLPYQKPVKPMDVDDSHFYEKTEIQHSTTTNEEYHEFEHKDYRSTITKQEDNLKLEGTLEHISKTQIDFVPVLVERPEAIKPKDNLKTEGSIEITRTRDDYTDFVVQERTEITKYEDNLRMEGEFTDTRTRDDYKVVKGERADIIKHKDNLYIEGPFEGKPKDDYTPKKVERPKPKKPEDNLKPEGEFEKPKKPEKPQPIEKRLPIKHSDNLKLEGDFEQRHREEFKPSERPVAKKPQDNLKPEGDFERPKPAEYKPTERPKPTRPQDNLYPEGEFERQPKPKSPTKGERAEVKRPQDNLKSEGEFEKRKPVEFKPAERVAPKRPLDNLYPEGEFERRPKEKAPTKGDRADIKKPKDNLKPEGEFERPKPKEYKPAERPVQKKPHDNLKPEGEFERPKPKEYRPAERPVQKKPHDNLKPEGEFERPKPKEYKPAERPVQKKPHDNLKPEGEFERPKPKEYKPAERPAPKRPHDNLYPEGEFERRPKEKAPTKGERAEVKKPKDNLKPEGDFERPKPKEYKPAERPVQKKPKDNLYPEGEFEKRPKEKAPIKGDRVDVKRPQDNLRPEGEFERPTKVAPGPGERRSPIKQVDNLRPEGEFERPTKVAPGPAERRSPIKQVDNLRPEGEFERPKPAEYKPAERPKQKRPQDNLRPEGEFAKKPKEKAPTKGERADVVKPKDNLKPEGPFEGRPKDDFKHVRGERVDVVKHQDNLYMEGDMQITTSKDDYADFIVRERAEITKYQDNLRMEGDFIDSRTRDDFKVVKGERYEIVKHEDNLRTEGTFEGRPKDDFVTKKAERPKIKKPEDNLKPEGDFERPEKAPVGPAERRMPIKQEDNLKPEGEFERPKPKEYKPAERRVQIIPQDNLYPEGEFERRPESVVPKKGERADVKKPQDNLKPEGEFERPEKAPVGPAEKRVPIKHEDNLRPEGEFERPKPKEFKPAERPVQIVPQDNLRPEGEFERPAPKEYKPAERPAQIVPQDNLRPEGEFERRPETKAPTKGERAEVKRPQDNLKPEGEFERPEKAPVGPAEKRVPIRHEDNLRPEGEFERLKPKEFKPAERPVAKKPKDNLKPEGEFEKRKPEEYKPSERPAAKRPKDNLFPEGEFERQPVEKAPVKGDRAEVKKPQDNLKPEGEFVRPEKAPVGPAEKRVPIKQKDNLKPEGEFERPKPKEYKPTERPKQKKPQDNLHPEGEFTRRPKEKAPVKGDRAEVKKPKDHLKPEGIMFIIPKEDFKPVKAERVDVIRREDNLHVEGDMQLITSRDDYKDFVVRERAEVTKYQDNLRIEGEFLDIRSRDDYKVFKGERVEVVKHEDNLRIEGTFERPEKIPLGPCERRVPIKHADNLKPEGDFERRPKEKTPIKGERRSPIKHTDNLRPEGTFDRPKPEVYKPSERPKPKKPVDNLHPEGEFERRPKEKTPIKGERADVRKPQDNLKLEGKIDVPKKSVPGPIERRSPIKHSDNLKPEGKFEVPEKPTVTQGVIERRTLIKHADNLKTLEGEFTKKHTEQNIVSQKTEITKQDIDKTEKTTEQRKVMRHSDLRKETEFQKSLRVESHTSDKQVCKKPQEIIRQEETRTMSATKNDYQRINGDNYRAQLYRREDHLRMEGHIESRRTSDDYNKKIHTYTRPEIDYNTTSSKSYKSSIQDSESRHHQESTKISQSSSYSPKPYIPTVSSDHVHTTSHEVVHSSTPYSPNRIESRQQQIYSSDQKTSSSAKTQSSMHREEVSIRQRQELERRRLEQQKYESSQKLVDSSSSKQIAIDSGTVSRSQRLIDSANARQSQSIINSEASSASRVASPTRTRWNVITSTTDISNTALHRRIASAERESSRQEYSQHQQVESRRGQSSLQQVDGNPWASSSYEREQRVGRVAKTGPPRDNLSVGGSFYHASEAKSYGSFVSNSQDKYQKVERVQRQSNVSHIKLGEEKHSASSSSYRKEFTSQKKGPCPAALLQANKAPFKHTRDTPRHKFYMPVIQTN